ncbi:MAG: peptidase M48 Ste24p, partial [Gammaproteobacteria bacterium]
LVFGKRAEDGVLRGRRFYHGPLGFTLELPAGWHVENLPDRLVARAPDGKALVQLTTTDRNRRLTPREFLLRRIDLRSLRDERAFPVHGLPGHTALGRADTPWGRRWVRYVVLFLDDRAYLLAGATDDPADPRRDAATLATARSFHRLRPGERRLAQPLRLHLVRARPGTRYAALARRSPLPEHAADLLRLLNHDWPRGEPRPGQLLKVVR